MSHGLHCAISKGNLTNEGHNMLHKQSFQTDAESDTGVKLVFVVGVKG